MKENPVITETGHGHTNVFSTSTPSQMSFTEVRSFWLLLLNCHLCAPSIIVKVLFVFSIWFFFSTSGHVQAQVTEFVIHEGSFDDTNMRCSSATGTAGFLLITPNSFANYSISSGRCLYYAPIQLLDPKDSTKKSVLSFSTTFTFSIDGKKQNTGGFVTPPTTPGFAFIIVADPNPAANEAQTGNPSQLQYLGVLNETSNNKNSSHTFALEFDVYNPLFVPMFNDPPYDHVGIDLNSMNSTSIQKAGFYYQTCAANRSFVENNFSPLNITSGSIIQAWIEYDGVDQRLTVTLGTQLGFKPSIPLLNQSGVDLSYIVEDTMYIGFSCAGVGSELLIPAFLYAWSFNTSGPAELLYSTTTSATQSALALDLSNCSGRIQGPGGDGRNILPTLLGITLPTGFGIILLLILVGKMYMKREKRALQKKHQLIELEELEYGPIKYTYKMLRKSTRDFDPKTILGSGGFGTVYLGILPGSGSSVAVKRLSGNSKQSEREFIAEVQTIGRLRHRNLVQLAGWCQEGGELLLVYEYMPNGSLDEYLFKGKSIPKPFNGDVLPWRKRFEILTGVANGLLYLHEEFEQRVVHRDIKASNVLLDMDFNARLGDFGLARSFEHSEAPASTMVAGTPGYLAPEATYVAKATPEIDVYSFGAVALEVVCGRRPLDSSFPLEQIILLERVWDLHRAGRILDAVDARLRDNYDREEVLVVLTIGLLCCQRNPDDRPSMRRVLQIIRAETPLPELWVPAESTHE